MTARRPRPVPPVVQARIWHARVAAYARQAVLADRAGLAAWAADRAACYPLDRFPPDSDDRDAIAGAVARHTWATVADTLTESLGHD